MRVLAGFLEEVRSELSAEEQAAPRRKPEVFPVVSGGRVGVGAGPGREAGDRAVLHGVGGAGQAERGVPAPVLLAVLVDPVASALWLKGEPTRPAATTCLPADWSMFSQ